MSADWVAGSTRARALARRRLGAAAARRLALRSGVRQAVDALAGTPYGHDVRPGQDLAAAQHGVARSVLWHLRVLAGWLPANHSVPLRVLAGGFELANLDARLGELQGRPRPPLFQLGSLSTAAPAIAAAESTADLRLALARSAWGDPGGEDPAMLQLGAQVAWAARTARAVPGAREWAAGLAAVAIARALLVEERTVPQPTTATAAALLGGRWSGAGDLPSFIDGLPQQARWVFDGIAGAEDLWRAEAGFWGRVADDGMAMLRRPLTTPAPVVGCAAVLAGDAWLVRAALAVAARRGTAHEAAMEVFDVVV